MIKIVQLTKKAEKDIQRLPNHIAQKLMFWVELVETIGLEEVRKIPGFHDEPLRGQRKNQRSIRLSRSYRAIYEIKREEIEFVEIEEVNKHDY